MHSLLSVSVCWTLLALPCPASSPLIKKQATSDAANAGDSRGQYRSQLLIRMDQPRGVTVVGNWCAWDGYSINWHTHEKHKICIACTRTEHASCDQSDWVPLQIELKHWFFAAIRVGIPIWCIVWCQAGISNFPLCSNSVFITFPQPFTFLATSWGKIVGSLTMHYFTCHCTIVQVKYSR